MSRLDELIAEFCPNGVEYHPLGDFIELSDGFPFNAKEFVLEGKYPVVKITDIQDGKVVIGKYFVNSIPAKVKKLQILTGGEILVGMSGSTGKTGYNEMNGILVNQRIAIIRHIDGKISNGYLRHLLINKNFERYCFDNGTGPQNNIGKSVISNYLVPVPPIEVQREIVRILDNFTELIAQLIEELTLRQKQFSAYSTELFDNAKDDWPVFSIGEICALEKGKTPIQKAKSGAYPLVVTTSERKTSDEYQFSQPSVCIPLVSSRGHGVAILNHVYYQEGKFALGNILCAISPNNPSIVLAKYLYYYFEQTKDYTLVPLMKGGANVALRMDDIAKVKVPVPSIEKQIELISVLQLFEEYCTVSIPAEIEVRRQQYEFYRDKLLTFKEKT